MQNENEIGVYQIRNLVNGKVYVGSTCVSFKDRWNHHLSDLKNKIHKNTYLQNAWNKYGFENFIFEIVEICSNEETTRSREQFYLNNLKEKYNLNPNADVPPNQTGKHWNLSEETKSKMRNNKNSLGFKHSIDTKRKMSKAQSGENNAMFGKKHSDESKLKLSLSHMGNKQSEETKKKIGEASRKRWALKRLLKNAK